MGAEVHLTNEQDIVAVDEEQVRRTVRHVLERHEITAGSVSVAFVDNDTIRRLKAEYFQMDAVTDVISFDLSDDWYEADDSSGAEKRTVAPSARPAGQLDCEVVVSAERAADVARDAKHKVDAELNLYVVHGLLHQLGYDDQMPEQARAMHQREDELLDELGFGRVFSRKG